MAASAKDLANSRDSVGTTGEVGGSTTSWPRWTDGYVLVHDLGPLHLFTADGGFVDRVGTSAEIEGPFAVRHLAGIGGGQAISAITGGVRPLDSPYKTGRQTLGVVDAAPDGLVLRPIAFVRNRFSDRSYTSFPPRSAVRHLDQTVVGRPPGTTGNGSVGVGWYLSL